MMHCSQRGRRFIQHFEGGQSRDGLFHAYLDTLAEPHVWTIGSGQTKNVKPGMVWTPQQASDDLERSLEEDGYADAVRTLHPANQNVFDAWCSIVYNLGPGAVKWDIGLLTKQGDLKTAAAALMQYDYSGGVRRTGLTIRRRAEGIFMCTPWTDPDPYHHWRFDDTPRHLQDRIINERETVEELDRITRRRLHWPRRTRRLRQNCGLLAARLEVVKEMNGGQWHGWQRWRYEQLAARRDGKRF